MTDAWVGGFFLKKKNNLFNYSQDKSKNKTKYVNFSQDFYFHLGTRLLIIEILHYYVRQIRQSPFYFGVSISYYFLMQKSCH